MRRMVSPGHVSAGVKYPSRIWGGGKSQGEQGFLLELVGFGGASGGAGAGGALHRADANVLGLSNALETRQNVEERAHVGRLLLDPDDFAGVGMGVNGGRNLGFGQWVELVQEKDCSGCVFAAAAFGAELVANFAAGDQDALRVGNLTIRH